MYLSLVIYWKLVLKMAPFFSCKFCLTLYLATQCFSFTRPEKCFEKNLFYKLYIFNQQKPSGSN